MKKIIFIFLMIFTVALCACDEGNRGNANAPGKDGIITPGASKESFYDYMASLKAENGTTTVFNLTLSGGVNQNISYTVSYENDCASGSVTDGGTCEFKDLYLSGAETFYNNAVKDGALEGNLNKIAFKTPSALFTLNDSTVKELYVKYNGDGTITYTPYIYEGKVKTAVGALQNQFEFTEDVLSLEFITDYLGSKTIINVGLSAKYKNTDEVVDIKLRVTYLKTIKTID